MKEPNILLEHILESISYIQDFIVDSNYEDFCENVEKQDAVQRRFEIIGEAVKNLPDELKNTHPEIPWRSIASMRDMLIHEYFEVSLKQVWISATEDIKVLKKAVIKLLEI
ncbi:DUF86 domain-containing protein [Candidatus Peregrinibacteria bacterium]|nr:DUF86 domain-containing protein [Candidatus Peregrinibacteria bacterium]